MWGVLYPLGADMLSCLLRHSDAGQQYPFTPECRGGLSGRQRSFPATSRIGGVPSLLALQVAIQRERPRASDAERKEARDIKQVGLIAGLAEVRTRRIVGHELDRAEAV